MTKERLIELAFIGAVCATLVLAIMRAIPMMDPDKDPNMTITPRVVTTQ